MSLEFAGLCVDIGRTRILSDVSFVVGDGTFNGLLGPNGSGKSTLLKTAYRVYKPAAGAVRLDGADVHRLAPRLVARGLAVVAQDATVEFDLTVTEMVMLGRLPHKGPFDADDDRDREIVRSCLDRVGCADLAGRSLHSLSGGEKQRVLVARALAQEADHLILDEPTNHLDIRYQTDILDLVADLGITVLAAFHDLGLAALYCDHVHLLAGGRVVAGGCPEQVITTETIEAVYGADVLVVAHPDTGAPQLLPRRATSARQTRPGAAVISRP
jgi:iron complex transport system ATP-binding protein